MKMDGLKFLSPILITAILFSFGCETSNPLCTDNYCVEGEIYPKSDLRVGAKYGELPIDDASIFAALADTQNVKPEPKISFKDDIQPILAERCAIAGCHAAPSVAGLDLSQYDTFKKGGANGPAFVVGNGDGSLIVKRIDGGGMPPGGPPLDADQVQLFIDWIDEGAKDN